MDRKLTDGFRLTGSELIVYVIICFVVVVSCYRKWNRRHFDRVAARLRGPPAYPLVGSGLEFIGTPEDVYMKLIKLRDDVQLLPFKIWMGSLFYVGIGNPEDIQIVLNSSKALEKAQTYNFFKNTVGEGLIVAPVHKWKRNRRIISPVFNTNLKDHFFPVFNEKAGILIENLKKEVGKTKTFDLLDYMAPTTLDIICQTAMGYDLGAQSNMESDFIRAWKKTSEEDSMRMYKPWLYPEFIFKIYAKLTGLDKLYKIFLSKPMQMDRKLTDGFRLTGSELIVYVIICFVVVVSCYRKWNRRHFDRVAARLRGPPAYPLVGSGLEFIGTPEDIYMKLIKLRDDVQLLPFKIWMGSLFFVGIGNPEDIQIVLNSSKALEKAQTYNFFKNTLGNGLIVAPVHKWKRNRRIISPVFNTNLKDHFFPVFNEKAGILIENLKKEVGKTKTFDLLDYMAPTTLDIICQTAMGYDLGAQSNMESDFIRAWKTTSEEDSMRMYKPWLYPEFIFKIYAKLTGLDKLYKIFLSKPMQIIKEMKEAYAKKTMSIDEVMDKNEGKRRKVFLDTLLELNEAGANFSDDDLRDEVVVVIIGGSETVNITLSFCLLMLAIHQDIQDKVFEELYEVFGEGDEIVRFEDTFKLVYMDQVIKETLRLYPTFPVFLRRLQDDVKISTDGLVLPKGSTCLVAPLLTHHISDLYPNPWEFDPERFNEENVSKRHKYSYLPFSGGPRSCIGSKYAMLSMKVILSTFLRNYSVHTDIKLADIKLKVDPLLKSAIGYPITIRARDKRSTYKRN